MILCFDEGQKDLNAKEALKKSSRRMEKLVAISRQQNIYLIYNSQIENVNKNMRGMTDIRLYKGITKTAISETEDKFAKDHSKFILNLYLPDRKKRCAFQSSYAYFFRKTKNNQQKLIETGYLDLELYDYVPYWDDDISKAYEDINLDVDFDDFLREDELVLRTADLFLDKFPNIETINGPIVRGWLRRYSEDTRNLYYDVKDHISEVIDEIKSRLFVKKYEDEQSSPKNQSNPGQSSIQLNFKEGIDFPEFLLESLKDEIGNEKAEMLMHWARGLSLRDLYPIFPKISAYEINNFIKNFKERGIDLAGKLQSHLRSGFLFEKWFAFRYDNNAGIIADPDSNNPDYIAGDGSIFSLKCYDESKKSITFTIDKDFHPEFKKAKDEGKKFIAVGYIPKWPSKLRFIEIEPIAGLQVSMQKEAKDQIYDLNQNILEGEQVEG